MVLLKKISLFIFVLFVLLLFVWALYLPKDNLQEKILKTLESQKEKADVSFNKVVFSETLGNEKFWELAATTAILNKETGIAELKDVKGMFFKNNKPSLYFISPFARWQMKQKEFYLDSPIGYDTKKMAFLKASYPGFENIAIGEQTALIQKNLKASQGYWFKAAHLYWNVATQKVVCNDNVILKGQDFAILSKGLEGDLGFNELRLTGNPAGLIRPAAQAESLISVEAEVFWFFTDKETFLASGNTQILYSSPQLKGKNAKLLGQQALFDSKTKEVACSGEVRVYYDDISAKANKADLKYERQTITLKENALIKEQKNKLLGQEITIWLKDKRIKVQGKTKILLND